MVTQLKTFKIHRTNEADLVVTGRLAAESTGDRYYVQVIHTEAGGFVLVVGDYRDGWQTAHQPSSHAGLLHTLRGFDSSPTPPPVMALLHGKDVDVKARQDLLVTVDAVLKEMS
jgi:hypothetical protein